MAIYNGNWKPDTPEELQSARWLCENVLDPAVLARHCPLDTWHDGKVSPKHNLGGLDILSLEIQQMILLEVDVEGLLTFRRTNKKAASVVNSMVEWRKINGIAPDAIRMAVGIRTAHTFNLRQLHTALCQKKCYKCGYLAPYIDVCNLRRRCLHINSPCRRPCHFLPADYILKYYNIPEGLTVPPSFTTIPGVYNHSKLPPGREVRLDTRDEWCNLLREFEPFRKLSRRSRPIAPFWLFANVGMLPAVFAPWFCDGSIGATSGVFCALCKKLSIPDVQESACRALCVDIPFYENMEDLRAHMEEMHGEEYASNNWRYDN